MNYLKYGLVGLFLLLFMNVSSAVPVTASNGMTYDITTATGSANDLRSTLEAQPWFGSINLAVELSRLTLPSFGFPNRLGQTPVTPYYLYKSDGFSYITRNAGGQAFANNTFGNDSDVWHVLESNTTPVPEPSTFLLMGLGLIGLTYARRRKIL